MANVIDYVLKVLATSPDEISQIAARLKQPSPDFIEWVAERWNSTPSELAPHITNLVSFEAKKNLFAIEESVNKARQFSNSFKRYTGIVNSHILEVSKEFPNAVFLVEYYDMQFSFSGKMVIHAGEVAREIFDGKQRAQAIDWALVDIFAPFLAEWDCGLGFGTLWSEWVKEVLEVIEDLRKTAA